MTYAEKLRLPEWQRKRHEIMKRDDYKCCMCGNGKQPLNVHHGYYELRTDPWEYDNDTLYTLCEECHAKAEQIKCELHHALATITPRDQHCIKTLLLQCIQYAKNQLPSLRTQQNP